MSVKTFFFSFFFSFFFFFFGDHLISAGKTIEILVKTFFLGDHKTGGPSNLRGPIISCLSSRGGQSNLRGPITSYLSSRGGPFMFELSLGPRSALGAPACGAWKYCCQTSACDTLDSYYFAQYFFFVRKIFYILNKAFLLSKIVAVRLIQNAKLLKLQFESGRGGFLAISLSLPHPQNVSLSRLLHS